jgi:hypothetical protein
MLAECSRFSQRQSKHAFHLDILKPCSAVAPEPGTIRPTLRILSKAGLDPRVHHDGKAGGRPRFFNSMAGRLGAPSTSLSVWRTVRTKVVHYNLTRAPSQRCSSLSTSHDGGGL